VEGADVAVSLEAQVEAVEKAADLLVTYSVGGLRIAERRFIADRLREAAKSLRATEQRA
jgi:hypothetical protein